MNAATTVSASSSPKRKKRLTQLLHLILPTQPNPLEPLPNPHSFQPPLLHLRLPKPFKPQHLILILGPRLDKLDQFLRRRKSGEGDGDGWGFPEREEGGLEVPRRMDEEIRFEKIGMRIYRRSARSSARPRQREWRRTGY